MAKKYHNGSLKQPKTGIANMPKDDIIQMYPELPCGGYSDYNDDMSGIDAKIKDDLKRNKRKSRPGNW